jgi:hypothetical protein
MQVRREESKETNVLLRASSVGGCILLSEAAAVEDG